MTVRAARSDPAPTVPTTGERLGYILALYEQGLYLQSFAACEPLGDLAGWRTAPACLIGGRLARALGGDRLGGRLLRRAWRLDRGHPEAVYFRVRTLADERGPIFAWSMLRRLGEELPAASLRQQSDWLALHARVLGQLRDFDRAERYLERAQAIDPRNPWQWVERCTLLEAEDRYAEALEAARINQQLQPFFRAAIQGEAHLLVLLGRDDEALAVLDRATARLECAWLELQRYQLLSELGRYGEAERSLERYRVSSPLLEEPQRRWLLAQQSDLAYHRGELARAVALAEESEDGFLELVLPRLREAGPDHRRVQLAVGFVRQHHLTCAPATLAAISQYWQRPADHLEVAAAICYDGTPAHSERRWAEEHGYTVREFTVNWRDAVALIDRGIPFTVTTVEPGNAHLQAIIGFDERRGTLLLRDPSVRQVREAAAQEFLERYRSTGPRGMIMLPADKEALLAGLTLEDAESYDLVFRVEQALDRHERAAAGDLAATLQQRAPEHRLTLQLERTLASYDADPARMLAVVDRQLAQFPDDVNHTLCKCSLLRALARRDERIALLRSACGANSDPLLWQQYAEELADDARAHRLSLRLLRRALRYRPYEARNYTLAANVLWQRRQWSEALELYRLAICLRDTDEQAARSFFAASQHFRLTAEALDFLAGRCERFGARSSAPVRTLYHARSQVGQDNEALEALRRGMVQRPDDWELQLFAANALVSRGEFDQAEDLLRRAEGRSQRGAWLRAAARIARLRGDLVAARDLWQQVADREPLAAEAAGETARLLAETEGPTAASDFLHRRVDRFPLSYALHQALIEWLRDDPPACEAAVRRLIELDPADAWARRELALQLALERRFDEAQHELEVARTLDAEDPSYHCVRGKVLQEMGDLASARAAYRETIVRTVDNSNAIGALIELADSAAERREALELVRRELLRQVMFGEGLLAWRSYARGTLEPEECLSLLEQALAERPDLWHAWSAYTMQLLEVGRLDDALRHSTTACERFPLLPRLWLDLGMVHEVRLEREPEIAALEHAYRIAPGWARAAQSLASAYLRTGDGARARSALERAVREDPLNPTNHGSLAELLYKLGERELALEHVRRAVLCEPGYSWGWNALRDWAAALHQPELALECARERTRVRRGEARSWLTLAQTLGDTAPVGERLGALERAIALQPRLVEAHALRARLLAAVGRYEEARSACRPAAFGDRPPAALRSAAAAIETQRGCHDQAERELRALVAEEPGYYPAWLRLADLHSERREWPGYLEAAQAMVRIEPHEPVALGYLGDALMQSGDKAAALESFRRAMRLDPEYGFAGAWAFDLSLEADDRAGAQEALELLLRIDGTPARVRRLRLQLHCGERAAALATFEEACREPECEPGRVRALARVEGDEAWQRSVADKIAELVREEAANPEAIALWVRGVPLQTSRRDWLDRHPPGDERWRHAAEAHLLVFADKPVKKAIDGFVTTYRDALRADAVLWGQVGYAWLQEGRFADAARWAADWRERPEVESWMLFNYAYTCRELGRRLEARAASERALELSADDTWDGHRLLLAADRAAAGEWQGAAALRGLVATGNLRNYERFLYQLVALAEDLGERGAQLRTRDLRRVIDFAVPDHGFDNSLSHRAAHTRVSLAVAGATGRWAPVVLARLLLWLRHGFAPV